MIPDAVVQEVRSRADIVQVIGDYIGLKRAGNSFKGLCPFHGEKSPSFHVTPSKGFFYCFGCGEGGSVIDFVMKMEGSSFPETVELLGRRFGVDVDRGAENQEAHKQRRRFKDEILGALKAAEAFYVKQYEGSQFARDYVQQRGINAEAAAAFRLGYAPDAWDELAQALTRIGITNEIAEQAGLIVPRKTGKGFYDRFRNRLIFPVIDARGQVIAFGGRALNPEDTAKYINSPESPVYTKGKALYGLHTAKEPMRKGGRAILVEGNLDVVQMWQAGFHATVAPMGTALTDEQAQLMKRHAQEVVCVFDGDKAGKKAALRSIKPLHTAEVKSLVALMPEGQDPDDFIRAYGAEKMQEILDAAKPLAGWAVNDACERVLAEPVEARNPLIKELKGLIESFSGDVVKRHYVAESARKIGVTPAEMLKLLGLAQARRERTENPSGPEDGRSSKIDRIEQELLRVLLDSTEKLRNFLESDGLKLIQDTQIAELLHMLRDDTINTDDDLRRAIENVTQESLRRLALESVFVDSGVAPENLEDWYRGAIGALTLRWIDREVVNLGHELEAALEAGDLERMKSLDERFGQLQTLRQRTQEDRKINWGTSGQDKLH